MRYVLVGSIPKMNGESEGLESLDMGIAIQELYLIGLVSPSCLCSKDNSVTYTRTARKDDIYIYIWP